LKSIEDDDLYVCGWKEEKRQAMDCHPLEGQSLGEG
jgi:hypothetical protein